MSFLKYQGATYGICIDNAINYYNFLNLRCLIFKKSIETEKARKTQTDKPEEHASQFPQCDKAPHGN